MKTSEIIVAMTTVVDGVAYYDSDKAEQLYKDGAGYHFLSIAKWVGVTLGKFLLHYGKFPTINLPGLCGYCFHYYTSDTRNCGCVPCPLNETMKNWIGDPCCNNNEEPLATLKNIIKNGR